MSWVRIYVHLIFTTKYRTPFLNTPELRSEVFGHIKKNAEQKNLWLDCVNGYQEHAHCLLALGKEQSISQVAQLIKGESSFWISKNILTLEKFAWQDDYWAVSVDGDHIDTVRNYIYSQEEHHRRKSFEEELKKFLKQHDRSQS